MDFHLAANHTAPGQPTSNHTSTNHMDKWVINLSKTSLPRNNYPFYKKAPFMPLPPNTPHRSIHNFNRTRANKLPTQEEDELRSDVNRILKQLQQQHNKQYNLNPLTQSPYST